MQGREGKRQPLRSRTDRRRGESAGGGLRLPDASEADPRPSPRRLSHADIPPATRGLRPASVEHERHGQRESARGLLRCSNPRREAARLGSGLRIREGAPLHGAELRRGMMRRACLELPVGVVLAASAFVASGSATTSVAPARVIDRTFVCESGLVGGGREIELRARSGFRSLQNPSQWQMLPSVGLSTRGDLTSISAGEPREKRANDPNDFGPFGSGLSVGATSCKPARASVRLSARGLSGGAASQLGDTYDCPAPWKVLVRVRGVFPVPTSLRLNRHYDSRAWRTSFRPAESPREAYFAVQTRGGKALAFAAAFGSGKARLFTAPSCTAE
jgi:hypothetical protein